RTVAANTPVTDLGIASQSAPPHEGHPASEAQVDVAIPVPRGGITTVTNFGKIRPATPTGHLQQGVGRVDADIRLVDAHGSGIAAVSHHSVIAVDALARVGVRAARDLEKAAPHGDGD